MDSTPKFYGPLADKLLRAYLALPEKSPLRMRFERLMVDTEEGEQQVPTPDTASGKFEAMGEDDMSESEAEGSGMCEMCGGSGECSCGKYEYDGEEEGGKSGGQMLLLVSADKGKSLSKKSKQS